MLFFSIFRLTLARLYKYYEFVSVRQASRTRRETDLCIDIFLLKCKSYQTFFSAQVEVTVPVVEAKEKRYLYFSLQDHSL